MGKRLIAIKTECPKRIRSIPTQWLANFSTSEKIATAPIWKITFTMEHPDKRAMYSMRFGLRFMRIEKIEMVSNDAPTIAIKFG